MRRILSELQNLINLGAGGSSSKEREKKLDILFGAGCFACFQGFRTMGVFLQTAIMSKIEKESLMTIAYLYCLLMFVSFLPYFFLVFRILSYFFLNFFVSYKWSSIPIPHRYRMYKNSRGIRYRRVVILRCAINEINDGQQ